MIHLILKIFVDSLFPKFYGNRLYFKFCIFTCFILCSVKRISNTPAFKSVPKLSEIQYEVPIPATNTVIPTIAPPIGVKNTDEAAPAP